MNIKEKDSQFIAHTYGRFPLTAAKGKHASCVDETGKSYIDFSSGIGVNSLGFCNAGWLEAVSSQAGVLQHISNLYYTKPMADLAQALCERTFAERVFFCNSGAEANEGMIKTARKYSSDHYGSGRHVIIALENSFHGRTIATLSATGQDVFHQHFGPFVEGFRFVKPGDIDGLRKAAAPGNVCGIMMELIQGEGGVVPLEKAFVQEAAALCAQKDILLMIDEVQTGIGRTGTFLCAEQFNIAPDLTSLAKGLGGGLPIGAVLFGKKCRDTLGPGDHATTFGGNPVCCAGGLSVLSQINDSLLAGAKEKGDYITKKVLSMPHVKSVEGLGLMLGITLDNLDSKQIAAVCLEQGLIILTAKAKLRMLPPLTITYEEIDEGLNHLNEVLQSI